MPYNLLNQLCTAQLPEKFAIKSDIDKLQFLRDLGLIEADIPDAHPECDGHFYNAGAIVMRVTPQGRAALRARTRSLPNGVVVKTARASVPSPFL